jgi:hypothetical protein
MAVDERSLEAGPAMDSRGRNYKWIALSNTTLGRSSTCRHGSSRISPAAPSFLPAPHRAPFASGLHLAFTFAAIATLIAIVASALRGKRYVHGVAAVEAEAPVDAVVGEMISLPADAETAGSRPDPEALGESV